MHLVVVSPFPPAITGVGQYGYHVTRALAESGLFKRITVLAGATRNAEHPNHLGVTEIEYCWEADQFNARQAILSRVKQLDPDLIWFNLRVGMFGTSPWLSISGLSTQFFTRRMGYPTIATLHELVETSDLRALNAPGGPVAPLGAHLLTDMATQADVVCLTMRSHLDWLTANRRNIDCVHIPLGASYEPILLEDSNRPELLLFNTLAPFKGLELLLEAFPLLKREYPELRLTIAGAEHPRFPGYAQSLQRRFGEVSGIEWLGKVADEDVIELFQRTQIVVLPYLASTGASSVLYQAATWGRAVVASNLNEICTLAKENQFQIQVFNKGSVESLQDAIRKLLDSPADRRAQAENNFRAIQGMRLEMTCRRYIEAFNRALEKRKIEKRVPIPSRIEPRPV
jgi:glycosyltransferase involved in cell wall biosynthesis